MEAPPVTVMPVTTGTINMMEYLLQGMERQKHLNKHRREGSVKELQVASWQLRGSLLRGATTKYVNNIKHKQTHCL